MSKKTQRQFKVLFVAGFGPIVQDIPKSHKFYWMLSVYPSKRRRETIYTQRKWTASRHLLCGRLRKQHSPVSSRRAGRLTSRFLKHGWSSTLMTLSKPAHN